MPAVKQFHLTHGEEAEAARYLLYLSASTEIHFFVEIPIAVEMHCSGCSGCLFYTIVSQNH